MSDMGGGQGGDSTRAWLAWGLGVTSTQLGAACWEGPNCCFLCAQVMQKDSEKNMSIKKLWK